MNKLIYRPLLIIGFILSLFIVIELGALSSMTWRNQQRINTIKQDIKQGNQLQQLMFELLELQRKTQESSPSSEQNKQQIVVHNKILNLLEPQSSVTQKITVVLKEMQQLLMSVEQGYQQDQVKALQLLRKVLLQQIQEEEQLLDEVYSDSQLELQLAILIPSVVFLILLIFAYFFLNRHVIRPIDALEELLSNLIEGEKRPIEEIKVDSVMQPLFRNYNRLVSRLSELELEHEEHTHSLEKKVRNATHTLLEQSHSLARADRLAAVGELAASAAHELRNPLAGIQIALENMCQDCNDLDMLERLQLVNSEVNRLTGRLNDLLAFSKQMPEPSTDIDLHLLVNELMTLLKYQVKENVTLQYQVEEYMTIFLPENEFRQALLNLLFNAIQSIGSQIGTVNLKVKQQGNDLIIRISDTGEPFPLTLLEQGIRPFASYKENGTGLGLPMVQRFAKAYSGKLEIFNDREGHACATLKFPYKS
jgi:signal transduction histidine kinase